MAVVVHYIEKSSGSQDVVINGIRGVILAIEDTVDTNGALVCARAVTVLNAKGQRLPVGYFDTNRPVSTLNTAGRCIVNAGHKIIDV